MLILAFDTTLAACSAAVYDAGAKRHLAQSFEAMERGHAEALVGMVRETVAAAGIKLAAVERLAVTIGPGTFTGVRIGLALARGLKLAQATPIVGFTSLEAIRLNIDNNAEQRPIAALIDARRGEFYLAAWSAAGELVAGPSAVRHAEAADVVPAGSLVIGTGADRFMDLAGSGRGYARANAPDLPDAARIAEAAAARSPREHPGAEPPQPLYLRPPGAILPSRPGDEVTIIEAAPEHAEVFAALHAACFDDGWPAADMARLMAMPGAVSLLAVTAQDPGRPAGFVLARRAADEAEIITIGIAPDYRRRGIARRLLGRVAEGLARAGVRSLVIEVAARNAAARALYGALGFAVAGGRPAYYALRDGGRDDAVLMRLGL